MLQDFNSVEDAATAAFSIPSVPSDLKQKKKKKRKSKRTHKGKKAMKKALRRVETERDQVIRLNGALTAQNYMLKAMITLAAASSRGRLDTQIIDDGLRLLPKGRDH